MTSPCARRRGAVPALLVIAAAGCAGQPGPSPVPDESTEAPAAPDTPDRRWPPHAPRFVPDPLPSRVALAAAPRIDLDANRPRWHVYDRGLVLPLAGEGLRKYDLAYRSPWRDAETVDGRAGRAVRGKAYLTFPWIDGDGPALVLIRARGPGRVRLAIDRRALAPTALPAGWSEVQIAVPAGVLAPGEHVLTVDGDPAIRWGEIELAPARLVGEVPVAAATAACERGWRRVSLYLELPPHAHLVARPRGGLVRVVVTGEDGALVSRVERAAAGFPEALLLGNGDRRMVVRLDLEGAGGCAEWDGAQIAVVDAPARARPPPVDNLVLVVVDTLRADRLAAYGPTRVQTPRLTAAAAARGAVFLHNQSMAPSSPPSHATIHTGQIPRVHGVTGDDGGPADGAPLLSALLGRAGLYTAFVGNNDFAMSRLRAPGAWDLFETPYYRHGKDCGPMFARAVAVAVDAARAGRRFFLTVLPIEPHVAYRHHEGVTDRYFAGPWRTPPGKLATSATLSRIRRRPLDAAGWDQLRALYDGEVEHVDACLGALEDGLAAAGVLDRTAIVVTSDHGEGLGERGRAVGHAYGLQRELVDVPLIVLGGVPAARVDVVSSNADIAPTVLDLLGLPADARMQGRSLVPDSLAAAPLPRVVASEYGRSYALRAAGWHLVVDYAGRATLHDVAVDPEEAVDRSRDAPVVARYLRDAAGLYLAHRTRWHAASWGALNDLAPGNPMAAAALPGR